MYENDYMYAIERNPDYLAHFGIKGMKWGVRKARESGNTRKLGRMYRKAQKKLAKLEKRANSGAKYARRAAALGAGAAAAGGLAAAGTKGVGNAINYSGKIGRKLTGAYGNVASAIGKGIYDASYRLPIGTKAKLAVKQAGLGIQGSGNAAKRLAKGTKINEAVNGVGEGLKRWGNSTSIGKGLERGTRDVYNSAVLAASKSSAGRNALGNISNTVKDATGRNISDNISRLKGISNNTIARIGAGAIGAGLAAGAGYNAYRAATTKRAARKAAQWRSEMNRAFKGTQYANGAPRQGKKRRR